MTTGQFITQLLAQCWRFFDLHFPGTGLTFKQIFIGAFVVGLSIVIMRDLLGFAGGVTTSASNAAHSAISSRRAAKGRRSQEEAKAAEKQYKESYEYYAANRAKKESYSARYFKEHKKE